MCDAVSEIVFAAGLSDGLSLPIVGKYAASRRSKAARPSALADEEMAQLSDDLVGCLSRGELAALCRDLEQRMARSRSR